MGRAPRNSQGGYVYHVVGRGLKPLLRGPVTGDFDARVGFSAHGLSPGCALEMAVILVDPPPQGWTETDRQKLSPTDAKNFKKVSLLFDVHGTPPYVSSECDEDNGFRIGWNRAYTLTEFVNAPLRAPISSNLYNRYGRNVPEPSLDLNAVRGELRLVRRSGFFAAYYRLVGQHTWWCSGTVWNEQMPSQVFLRLAAKHWKKTDKAPAMTVRFFEFELLSPTHRAL